MLSNKRWEKFFIEDVADIVSGRDINSADQIAGKIPYISSSSVNNGVYNFVDNENETLESKCISVNRTGSVGYAFYHPYAALYSNNVRKLRPHVANDYVSLFIANQITSQRGKYNYGYILGTERLKRQQIFLPVNEIGLPDYDFMEAYIAAIEEKILQRYREFVQAVDAAQIAPLNEKIWRPFIIGELFRLEAGKCSQANQLKKSADGVPYIGATNRNNGVLDFVEPDEKFISRGNAIAFVCDGEGSMGYSFYKAEDCIATTNIIFGYADFLNRYVGAFITTVADKVRGKYSYNYKRRLLRLKREQLMLPVNDSGSPDFEYMEAFTKNLVAEQYRRYLNYVDGE